MPNPVMGFPTQKAAAEHARKIWNEHPPGTEFQDEWLSDLVATRHYYCAWAQVRPTLFCRRWHPDYGTEDTALLQRPDGRLEWRSISWLRAIKGATIEDKFRACFRELAKPFAESIRISNTTCEECGLNPAVDAHHVDPSFDAIFRQCMAMVSESDIAWIMRQYWEDGAEEWWPLHPSHPATQLCIDIHESARMISVCKKCHKALHRR